MAYSDPLSINPGDLRTPITILAKNPAVKDIAGQPIPADYLTVYTATCKITLTRSAEVAQNQDLVSTSVYKVRLWKPSITISSGMIAVINGQNYDIQSVDDVLKRGRVLELVLIAVDEAV